MAADTSGAAFAGLLDDAAVFPPGNLPLAEAVLAHRGHHGGGYAEFVGPLVLPAAALVKLAPLLDGAKVALSVTLSGEAGAAASAVAAAAALDGATLAAVEAVLPGDRGIAELVDALDAELPPDVLGYVEVPRDERGTGVLDALNGSRYRAKFRTGGTVPAAHPSEPELAGMIAAAVDRKVTFKCTAGLHHAIRHTDGELEQHGFLNVLLATEAALGGAGQAELVTLLGDRSAARVADLVRQLGAGRLAATRASFGSFGTCSVTEPLQDLVALGLLAESALR
jgi:hypothetical protein